MSPASQDVFAGTIAELTWQEVRRAGTDGAIVLWAFGVIEEHGPHLPCGTDVYLPMARVRAVREELRRQGIEAVIMPPYYWGVNVAASSFPGTYNVRPETMQQVIVDLVTGLARDGFRHVFCFSGHGNASHNQTIYRAAVLASQVCGMDVSFVAAPSLLKRLGLRTGDPQLTVYQPAEPDGAAEPYVDEHAGNGETSLMMSAYPQLVREQLRTALSPTELGPEEVELWRHGHFEARRLTPDGYVGDPARATSERGQRELADEAGLAAAAIAERVARLAPGDPDGRPHVSHPGRIG